VTVEFKGEFYCQHFKVTVNRRFGERRAIWGLNFSVG